MSESITIEKVETDLKKFKNDLTKIRGYVSAHRDELCAMASTNVLNQKLKQYLPDGYAFKRNYGVLGIRSVKGPVKETKTTKKTKEQPVKRPRRIIEPEDDYEDEEEYEEEDEPEEKPKRRIVKRPPPKKKVQPSQPVEEEEEDEPEPEPKPVSRRKKQIPQQDPEIQIPIQQSMPRGYVSNKNIARNFFKEKALKKFGEFF
ncbi:hypothetical protein TRFO_25483 [Tritrichomonas foetus]|uniref:Uncharacterized protein n=1 Tax=Tritrichomonas foetus TaxID=1144522 RepID=A0A1J4K9T5_9EUKA|nr:hypothetical protein TRFO_25483 [Tritrichomonas foetus]|eukprot:OHT06460.1 hypothetical protein TRFO_25483 [Tritrichomonas foetus]